MHEVMLDTHVMLWWMSEEGGPRLTNSAQDAIDGASRIMVSAITFWEIAMLRSKGRVDLDRPTSVWCHDALAEDRLQESEVSASIGVRAGELPDFHGDLADRIIVATALARKAPLITKDRQITRWAQGRSELAVIW